MALSRETGRALRWGMGCAVVFTAFIALTTQFQAVRMHSPWQDDPYDVVISSTELLVPALAAAIAMRAWMRRALPAALPGELLRAARVVLVAVALTVLTCWAAVASVAHAAEWGGNGRLLIAGLAIITVSTVPAAVALCRAGAAAPGDGKAADADWIEDLLAVAGAQAARWGRAGRFLGAAADWVQRVIVDGRHGLRRHRIAAAVLLATVTSGWLALAEALGDGLGPRPATAAVFRIAVGAVWLVAVLVPLNAYLRLLRPAQPRGTRRWPALRSATYTAAVSVPVTIAFRDRIGFLLDYPPSTLGRLTGLIVTFAAIAALVAVLAQAFRTRRRRIARIVVAVPLVLVLAIVGYLGVVTIHRVLPQNLPAPTGAYRVGRMFREWTDTSRTDPLAPQPGRQRELSVWIWYPAPRDDTGPRAAYAPGEWARQHIPTPLPGLGEGSFAAVRTQAIDGARVAAGRFPLIVLAPGMGLDAPVFSTLAQELASHGYVVASLTPTYSANVTVLHGHAVTSTQSGNPEMTNEPTADRVMGVWTADARFVADHAAQLDRADPLAGHLDTSHPVYIGHSFGGATALQACHDDPRCAGAVDLDGALHGTVVHTGLRAPALILGGENSCVTGTCRATDPENQAMRAKTRQLLAASPGPIWRYEIAGAGHFNFTDYAVIYLAAPIRALFPLESIDGAHGLRIQNAYVDGFLDQVLRHRASPLLTGDRPYPEVRALR